MQTSSIESRRKKEEKLREAQELNRALFDQAVTAVYIANLNGEIIEVNRAACRQSGYSREELLYMTVFDLKERVSESRMNENESLLETWGEWEPGEHYTAEEVHVRQDGSTYPVIISTGAIQYGDRKAIPLTDDPVAIAPLEDSRNRLNSLGVLYDHLYQTDARGTGSIQKYLPHLVSSEVQLFLHGDQVEIHAEFQDCMCTTKILSSIGLIVNGLVTNAMKYAFRDHQHPELTIQRPIKMLTMYSRSKTTGPACLTQTQSIHRPVSV